MKNYKDTLGIISREDYIKGHGNPKLRPNFIGQFYLDIDRENVWVSVTYSKDGWQIVSGPDANNIEFCKEKDISNLLNKYL